MDPTVHYTLHYPDTRVQRLAVEVRLATLGRDSVDLAMPAWTPGSYKVRDFARNVRDISASGPDGLAMTIERLDKQTWRVHAPGVSEVRVSYWVRAAELTVRTSHADAGHALVNGASVFLYVVNGQARPVEIVVAPPPGWRIDTTLGPAGDGRYLANGYDELIDHPIEMGTAPALDFDARGVPHRLVVCGRGNLDAARLAEDCRRIVEANAAVFGAMPYDRYLFVLHLAPDGGGGLEHATSTCLQISPFAGRPAKDYRKVLLLVAHEHFHAWNVKRLRPAGLAPMDYARENYTRLLWVAEGWTSYYETLAVRRAGLMDDKAFLDVWSERIADLEATPGREAASVEDASFEAWVRLYQPDADTPNASVSYYLKGALVALALDLQIRAATAGGRSLDDTVRALWDRRDRPYDSGAVLAACEEAAGTGLGEFFDRCVSGREDPDLGALLAPFGLRVVRRPEETDGEAVPPGWIGVRVKAEAGRAMVATVLSGSPAERAGLLAGDEIVAVDGGRVDAASWEERVRDIRPGGFIDLALFRRDRLVALRVEVGERPLKPRIERQADAPAGAARLYEGWVSEDSSPPNRIQSGTPHTPSASDTTSRPR